MYWENKRIEHINSFSKVVVPSYCDKCNSHRAFIIDIADYLKSVIAVYGPHPVCLLVAFAWNVMIGYPRL